MNDNSWFGRVLAKRDQKALTLVTRNLGSGEELLFARMGTFDDVVPFNKKPSFTSGVMGVTPIRVIRVSEPFENVRSIPLERISAVNQSVAGGGLFTKVEVVAPNESLDIQCNSVNAQELVNAIQEAMKTVATSGYEPKDTNPLAQLEKLAELHEKGVLSDEEFADKKAKLLGQI